MSVMRILFAAATLIAISTSAGLIALQWWWPSGSDEPTDVLAETLRDNGSNRRNDSGSFGWLAFLVLLLLVNVAFWPELWWRSRVLTTVPRVPVVREGTDALARRVKNVASLKVDVRDR